MSITRFVMWGVMGLSGLSFAALAGNGVAAGGDAKAGSEAKAIETTIRAQIDAFSRDDADAAFRYATPKIQKMFGGDSSRFLRTVREGYPAVYRPSSLFFLPPKRQGESWVQMVNVADSDGKLWVAYYDMRQQPDKSWKINGCELVETAGTAI